MRTSTHTEIETLSSSCPLVDYELGDFIARYILRGSAVELVIFPLSKRGSLVTRRRSGPMHPEFGSGPLHESHNTMVDPLAHVSLSGHAAHPLWVAGGSMRNSASVATLRFILQSVVEDGPTRRIETRLSSELGFDVHHALLWTEGDPGFRVETTVVNTSEEPLPLEMLTSFSLTGISPFVSDDAVGRLKLHRFRSTWSNEGQHTVQDFGDLGLERTWGGGPVYLRYGQAGSLPVRKFHPWIAVEDTQEGVMWGATLAWHGSWQMEVYRRDDAVAISGGLGDFELAHWMKQIAPGQSFTGPTALVATCVGDVDELGSRLVEMQKHLAYEEPEHELDLPIVFNEWCSSWGKPTHDYLIRTADRLQKTDTKYLVIDDGWAEKPEGADIQHNGDWNINQKAFPYGIDKTTEAIRERGLIPGIWFEFEPCTQGTDAYELTDHQLQRNGQVLKVGNRHFWDFRDPWTYEYLTEKVIKLLRDNGFGYLKVDYNESIGLGCDGAESLGEGLRQHLVKVKEFFELIRQEVPGIVIENCASGGHRLEPGMVGLTSMSSFSDAHETVEIPIIAAQMHRLIPVHKNQVWAVLKSDDSVRRLYYSLVATFLGRMCISGEIVDLSDDRLRIVQEAQSFYQKVSGIIRDGRSKLYSYTGSSRRRPTGWQASVREAADQDAILVVAHAFDLQSQSSEFVIPLPEGKEWGISDTINLPESVTLTPRSLKVDSWESFSGFACKLVAQ